jgi:hypothetical protein
MLRGILQIPEEVVLRVNKSGFQAACLAICLLGRSESTYMYKEE